MNSNLPFLWDILLGLVAGFLAKLILPGDKFEPKGCVTTAILGMFGGALGGFLFRTLNIAKGGDLVMHLLGALVGSILLIVLGRLLFSGRDRTPAS